MARGRTKNSKVDIRLLTAEQANKADDEFEDISEEEKELWEEAENDEDLRDDLIDFAQMRML